MVLTEKLELSNHQFDKSDFRSRFSLIPTLNDHGFMINMENPHFSLSKKLIDKSLPVADLGVAFGFTSRLLLNDGFNVIANDLDEKHLECLWNSINDDEEKSRLTLKAGNALDLEFEDNSLGGIIALKWIHFLTGDQIREMFSKFYRWLAPNGILVVSVYTPMIYRVLSKNKIAANTIESKYFERVKNKEEWPGEYCLNDWIKDDPDLTEKLPTFVHHFFNDIMFREISNAGFHVLKCEYFDLDYENNQYIRDGLDMVETSIICKKV